MPLKSWAFIHKGSSIRVEIWWRFSGWNRKRMYVDHRFALGRHGRFTFAVPIQSELTNQNGSKESIEVRFKPKRLGFDMDCECTIGLKRIEWKDVQVQVEKKRQHSATSDGMPGVIYDNEHIGCLIVFPMLALLAVLSIPMSIIGLWMVSYQELKLKRQLRKHGRLLPWAELDVKMRRRNSPCTLIVQMGNMAPFRAWWTEDDVLTISPLPIPKPFDIINQGRHDNPFIEWCWFRYLSEATGGAVLTELPQQIRGQLDRFEEVNDHACCHSIYPSLNVVVTGYPHDRRKKAAPEFVRILGDDLEPSMPRLIAAMDDPDRTLRQMCREAVAAAGPAGGAAIPLLSEQFYFGPWSERHGVATTLVELGKEGEDVLKTAATYDDPYLRSPATSALHMHGIKTEPARRLKTTSLEVSPEARQMRRKKIKTAVLILTAYLAVNVTICIVCFLRYGALAAAATGVALYMTGRMLRNRNAGVKSS